jgi:hypothetical protein
MGDGELDVLAGQLRSMEAKLDRIESRIESFVEANARHSERLKTLDGGVRLAHHRISDMKKRFVGVLIGVCGAAIGIIWNWVKSGIGK